MGKSLVFAGVELHPDGSMRHRGEWQDTTSCHAEVDTAGQVRDRATVTRVVGGALVAGPVGAVVGGLFRKRVDEREVVLVITGDRYDWVVRVPAQQRQRALQFATAVNNEARRLAAMVVTPDPAVTPYRRRTGVYRPGLS